MRTRRPLMLHNSLGRRLEAFEPLGPVVRMYSCGPTVYSFPHLGNMRAYVFADTLRRALQWNGHEVEHVINITDVGHPVADSELGADKLDVAADREEVPVAQIAEMYAGAFFTDIAALNVLPATEYPRATSFVTKMMVFAADLEARGFAYRIPSGLYFDTTMSKKYGELALINLEGQLEGARVEYVEGRRTKSDFALWRAEKPGEPRAMRWDSPWGWGQPGWHLECSVMSMELLGAHFDIHTGGVDHRELHHVNEIAQSEAYLGDDRRWVNYWLHNEFLHIDSNKMAKSAGGAPLLVDLTKTGAHPLAHRMFLLGAHYRAQMDFTWEAVKGADAALRRLAARITSLLPLPAITSFAGAHEAAGDDEVAHALLARIDEAVNSDLNTPQILAIAQQSLREPGLSPHGRSVVLASADALLGLRLGDAALRDELSEVSHAPALSVAEVEEIEGLVAARSEARLRRDWTAADELRASLLQRGVEIIDTPQGSEWVSR